ncbi:MAG: 3D domain-containing protein [Phycisphaerae bacterium]
MSTRLPLANHLTRGVIVVALFSTLSLVGAQKQTDHVPASGIAVVTPAAEPTEVAESTELLVDDDTALADLDAAELAAYVPPVAPAFDVVMFEVTAYCPCTRCCGPQAQGITASGRDVSYNEGRFVAADTSLLPFGTKLVIPGYAGEVPVEVIDRGGAIKGHKLDVYFDDHDVALQWGRQWVAVKVLR